jgi:lysophospholipase
MPSDLAIAVLRGAASGMRVGVAGRSTATRGTLVVLPGRAEFIEKYAETVEDFGRLGFAGAVVEWRGQGLSLRGDLHPGRGFVADYEDYLDDLSAALDHLEATGTPRPWAMLGHSMGGHVGLRWLQRTPGSFAAAAMTAPMFGIPLLFVPELAARFLGRTFVRFGGGRRYAPGQRDFLIDRCIYERNPLTSCPVRFQSYRDLLASRPELALGGATWGWVDASLRSIALTRAPGYLDSIRTPMLLCVAGRDRVVDNRAVELFARRLPHAKLRRFTGARHELLLERDEIRNEVLAAIDAFLAAVSPPVSRPALAAAPPLG